jgi:TRAP-type uncharacterized transport system fused permease subunit
VRSRILFVSSDSPWWQGLLITFWQNVCAFSPNGNVLLSYSIILFAFMSILVRHLSWCVFSRDRHSQMNKSILFSISLLPPARTFHKRLTLLFVRSRCLFRVSRAADSLPTCHVTAIPHIAAFLSSLYHFVHPLLFLCFVLLFSSYHVCRACIQITSCILNCPILQYMCLLSNYVCEPTKNWRKPGIIQRLYYKII